MRQSESTEINIYMYTYTNYISNKVDFVVLYFRKNNITNQK